MRSFYKNVSLLFLAIFVFMAISGCGRVINRTAERKIRDVLPVYLGPAKVWRAHVDNNAMRTLGGKLSVITIDGEDVQLQNTIECQQLHIVMHDVDVDVVKGKLKSVGPTSFSVLITQQSLNRFLHGFQYPEGERLKINHVGIQKGLLTLNMTWNLLGRDWSFTVTGQPELVAGNKLELEPNRLTVLGIPAPLPASALRYIAHFFNHAFDFSTLPFPVYITQAAVDNNQIELSGTADVMKSLNEMISTSK
jgi:uncharacterized protein YceK